MTIFWTVLSGTCVFILGQIFVEFGLRPVLEFRKIRRKILYNLYYFSNRYSNSQMRVEDFELIRELAAELKSYSYERSVLYRKVDMESAISGLIGLSNSGGADQKFIREMVEKVEQALNPKNKNVTHSL